MSEQSQCYIIGAGGHARVVLSIFRAGNSQNPMQIKGFISNRPNEWGTIVDDIPVLGDIEILSHPSAAIIAVGDNKTRASLFNDLTSKGIRIISAIHPSTMIDPNTKIEEGVMICPGVVINTGTHVGVNTIINTSVSIDHDCKIGKHVHIAPGATLTGNVTVGDRSFIGAGTTIIPGIIIGSDVTVGAGAVVTKDVPNGTTVVGVPAKPMERYHK